MCGLNCIEAESMNEVVAMRRICIALVPAIICAAAACTDSEPVAPAAERETVFDPMVDTIEEAEQVDDLARSRMDTLNEQLEQSEGGRDP